MLVFYSSVIFAISLRSRKVVIVVGKRHAISGGKSRRMFSKTAGNQKVHPKNVLAQPVNRGGIRL